VCIFVYVNSCVCRIFWWVRKKSDCDRTKSVCVFEAWTNNQFLAFFPPVYWSISVSSCLACKHARSLQLITASSTVQTGWDFDCWRSCSVPLVCHRVMNPYDRHLHKISRGFVVCAYFAASMHGYTRLQVCEHSHYKRTHSTTRYTHWLKQRDQNPSRVYAWQSSWLAQWMWCLIVTYWPACAVFSWGVYAIRCV